LPVHVRDGSAVEGGNEILNHALARWTRHRDANPQHHPDWVER
jgi:hypothetical protein